jgi:Integrase core domain
MGIRDQPTSPRSPWQNGYAERLIGSIRRECLDHVVVLGECHLRHLLLSYMKYYNGARTHLSLEKDAPFSRAVERAGQILCRPILGGLHHQYVRIRFSTGTGVKSPFYSRTLANGRFAPQPDVPTRKRLTHNRLPAPIVHAESSNMRVSVCEHRTLVFATNRADQTTDLFSDV